MKKLVLLLLLMLSGPVVAQQSVQVPATMASFSTAGVITAITQIVPAITGQRIYITAVTFHPASTAVLTLSYGTGTNCGTGTVAFYTGTFQAGEAWFQGTGNGAIFALPISTALCITIATAAAPGFISYAQY
jgi:hypothetical protein